MTIKGLLSNLNALLDDRVSTSPGDLQQHAVDESYHEALPPDAVVYPRTVSEVSEIVRMCAADAVPVVPFGTGTSLEGHIGAVRGGVTLDTREMNGVVEIRPDDLDVTVEAGVTHRQLNAELRRHGLFFPVDPGADASIGGMCATGASGTTTVRYGTMRENVLALRVVLANGEVITTRSRARKSSAGYDLTRLFIGSEGTLGVICEVTLRVYGIPEAISAAVCSFPSMEQAVESVIRTIQFGVPIARCELVDEVMLDGLNQFSGLSYQVAPTLFFEFHGSPAGVAEQAQVVQGITEEHGGSGFEWATTQEDRSRLWHARHNALYAALALRPGSRAVITDVCVPISALARCIVETKEDLSTSGLLAPLVGHVGDGNFHLSFIVDTNDPGEMTAVKELNARLVARALEMGGTCTGEHGIGRGKIDALVMEHGEGVHVMRQIKDALDPQGIMNPGKIFRDTE